MRGGEREGKGEGGGGIRVVGEGFGGFFGTSVIIYLDALKKGRDRETHEGGTKPQKLTGNRWRGFSLLPFTF